jgi:hypothetical protein
MTGSKRPISFLPILPPDDPLTLTFYVVHPLLGVFLETVGVAGPEVETAVVGGAEPAVEVVAVVVV